MNITTIDELTAVLTSYGIDINLYGQGTTKSLHLLFNEIKNGEVILSDDEGQLVRNLRIMSVILVDGDRVLIETKQVFHKTASRDEWQRERYCCLTEKALTDESIEILLIRAIEEELGMIFNGGGIIKVVTEYEQNHSMSYPGLLSKYKIDNVHLDVTKAGLSIPPNYVYTEYFADMSPRLTTYWQWLDLKTLGKVNPKLYKRLRK